MREYDVDARNTYNMDEKGFFIGITNRTKRVFSKALWASGEIKAAIQDGNREWVTLLACVCASGEVLPPAIIYKGTAGIQSSWVDAVEVAKHEIFFSNSATGWSNNDIGMAWLEQVFERFTKPKARRDYRLLILDGHGSHVSTDFIDFCDGNRILLAIFPPHATHSLQPLDVVVFAPMSKAYSKQLDRHLHESHGTAKATKREFFSLFWPAWSSTMTPDLIKKSFQATGVWPMDAQVILKRFNKHPQQQDETPEIRQHGDGDSWRELRKVFDAAVGDKSKVEAQRLEASFWSLQVQNELLHHENEYLDRSLNTKTNAKKKSKTLDLQQRKEYHGGAVFWSPRKLREARYRESVREEQKKQEQLQKAKDKDLKAAAKLYNLKISEAAKVARQEAKIERERKQKQRAEEKAAAQALKQQQQQAATPKKTHDTANKRKREASAKPAKNPAKRRRVVAPSSQVVEGPPRAPSPPKFGLHTRQIKTPARYK
jgi:hypothetical protein